MTFYEVVIVEDTEGSSADLATPMAKLLAGKPDMIYAVTTAHAIAAKKAISVIPAVYAWVGDPVQVRLIESYAASRTNATGVSTASDTLSGKRLEALLEIAPKIKRVLTIVTPAESIAVSSMLFLTETAKKLGVQLVRRGVANGEELELALRETPGGSVDAIYYVPSVLMLGKLDSLIKKAKKERLPLIVPDEVMVKQGAKPSEIIVETPEKLFLAINLTTAREIGITIPRGILERTDSLIE